MTDVSRIFYALMVI